MVSLPEAVWSALQQVPARVSLVFRDLDRHWEMTHDADRPVTAASTIKLLVLAALYRAFARGDLDPNEQVTPTPEAVVPGSGVLRWLQQRPTLTLRDLAVFMVIVSDNTASNLLLERLGWSAFATLTHELGLAQTALRRRFAGRAALPGEEENVTSARDLTQLLASLEQGKIVPEGLWLEDLRTILTAQQFRDIIPARLPAAVRVGNKTGSLPGFLHDAALLWAPHGRATLVLLSSDVRDSELTRRALADLARVVYNEWWTETTGAPSTSSRGSERDQ